MVRIAIPYQLQVLANTTAAEIQLDIDPPVTINAVLDALETRYPMLRGAILDHERRERRPRIRFFACNEDLSHDPLDTPLPEPVTSGKEPFLIIGAISGG